MNRRVKTKVTNFLIVALAIIVIPAFGEGPDGVSPGAVDRMAEIEGRCPTFIWGTSANAVGYELVAYHLPEGLDRSGLSAVDLSNADQVLYAEVPGTASAWTPELAECLAPGGNYVWFVRAVFGENQGEVVEAGEWSYGKFFSISPMPSGREVEEALSVLRRYVGRGFSGATAVDPQALETELTSTERPAPNERRAVSSADQKSVTSAKTAIKGTVGDASGETYGVVGISNSPNGAGLAAANTGGGPDLVLDGSADAGDPDAVFTQAGIDRASASDTWFFLLNSDPVGKLNLNVEGQIVGDGSGLTTIDAANITTGRLPGVQLPVYTPWDCRWYVGTSSGTNAATVTCSGDRQLVSGFCYTADSSCGVSWYRPNGLDGLTAGTYEPVEGTGMYCSFTGSCSGAPNQNKVFALCCDFD